MCSDGEIDESEVTAGVDNTEVEDDEELTENYEEEDLSEDTDSCASYDYDGEPDDSLEEAVYSDEEGLASDYDDDEDDEDCGDYDHDGVGDKVFYY